MSNMRAVVAIALLLGSGCAVRKDVRYDLGNVQRAPAGALFPHRLVVQPFVERRDPVALGRRGTTLAPAIVHADYGDWYATSDDHYRDTNVPASARRRGALEGDRPLP